MDFGGILKSVTDPGALVNSLAHQLLPKDLQFLGGVAGAFVDYEAGNPVGALKQGLSAFQDLSQNNLSSSRPTGPGGVPSTPWRAEPTPPFLLASQSPAPTTTPSPLPSPEGRSAPHTMQPAGAPPAAPPRATGPATPTPPASSPRLVVATAPRPSLAPGKSLAQALSTSLATPAWRGTPPPTPPRTEPRPSPTDTSPPAGTTPPAATTPSTSPTPGTTTPPTTTPPATTPPATTPSTTTPAAASTSSSSSSQNQPITDAAKAFLNQGNDALMNAIRSGNIPAAVSDSPAAMMALQAKMNHISEMNQLMTSMMMALHQMQMSIIQNVRV